MSVIVLSTGFSKFGGLNAQLQGISRLLIGHTDRGTKNYNVGTVVMEVCRVGNWDMCGMSLHRKTDINQEKP